MKQGFQRLFNNKQTNKQKLRNNQSNCGYSISCQAVLFYWELAPGPWAPLGQHPPLSSGLSPGVSLTWSLSLFWWFTKVVLEERCLPDTCTPDPHKGACSEPPQPDTTIRSVVRVHRSLTKWLVTYCVCSGWQWGSLHRSSFIATVIPKHNLAWVCTTNDKIRMKFCKRSRHYSWLQRSRIFVFKI